MRMEVEWRRKKGGNGIIKEGREDGGRGDRGNGRMGGRGRDEGRRGMKERRKIRRKER